MTTYLAPNHISLDEFQEPQALLHELQKIRQTVIYQGDRIFRSPATDDRP